MPGKASVQVVEWGDDVRDSGRICVSGEVRANEGARATRIGGRGRGRRPHTRARLEDEGARGRAGG